MAIQVPEDRSLKDDVLVLIPGNGLREIRLESYPIPDMKLIIIQVAGEV